MFPVSGELISETRSIIIAHRFGTFRTFRPFRDILDILPVLGHFGHFGHFARFETFGTNRTFWTKRKAAAPLPESAAPPGKSHGFKLTLSSMRLEDDNRRWKRSA